MKTIKYVLWLIIIVLLGILIYQNLEYFMTTQALRLDLKVGSWHWTTPALQNIAYFGICFVLGLILAGIKGFAVKLGLKKEIKTKNSTIASLTQKADTLQSELDVFQHDPYIKKQIQENALAETAEDSTQDGKKSDTMD
ncbi:hypothetical protein [Desulfobacula sp.]|uniref:hypothetical protein n=1 Tax=Desulfobacula sp. TaxID=2593537 RepID=UPI002621B482|nr:hypothetical protein [Desulfobacula sp.]